MKDIEQPQHLYQLVIDGLDNEFGPLKTLDVELKRRRRRMYVGSALIGVIAAAVAIPVFALGEGGSGGGVTVRGDGVAVIDRSSRWRDHPGFGWGPSGLDCFRLRGGLGGEPG